MIKAVRFLLDAMFPKFFTCDICGIESFGKNLCAECLKTVKFNSGYTCPVCGRKTQTDEVCIECKFKPPLFKKAVSALVYEGGAVKLIYKFKNGKPYLCEYFADIICEKLDFITAVDNIIFVPMTKRAVYKREYNQAQLLAESISKRMGIPVFKDAVIKNKETPEQKSLSVKERAKNLAGCFSVADKDEIRGKTFLLVDDVITTGATANAICEKLLKVGAANVYLATVASVEYKPKTSDKNN